MLFLEGPYLPGLSCDLFGVSRYGARPPIGAAERGTGINAMSGSFRLQVVGGAGKGEFRFSRCRAVSFLAEESGCGEARGQRNGKVNLVPELCFVERLSNGCRSHSP